MFKKSLVVMTTCVMAASMLFGCAKKEETPAPAETKTEAPAPAETTTEELANLVNPMAEVSKEEMVQVTGIDIDAPEGATDVTYNTIVFDDTKIAYVDFEYDGIRYLYRAVDDGATQLNDDAAKELSGLMYDFEDEVEVAVTYAPGKVFRCEDATLIAWADAVPGITYALGTINAVDTDEINELANFTFHPAQGEVGGDETVEEAHTFRIVCQNEECSLYGQPNSVDAQDETALTCPECGGEVEAKLMD